jgi:hypothetical protein
VRSRVAIGAVLAWLCALNATTLAQPRGNQSDPHLSDAAAALYQRSPFAHGYIHGYEEGFHAGDQDVQFGRLARGERTKRSSHPRTTMQSEDPASFHNGYEQGFSTGYRDSTAGREFRAIAALRQAAAALPAKPAEHANHAFDASFRTGYFAGEAYAAHTEKPLTDFNYVAGYCAGSAAATDPEAAKHAAKNARAADCSAYTQGFRIGYADARIQRPTQTTASAK